MTVRDWSKLKPVGRFLVTAPAMRAGQAMNASDTQSTSGGILTHGRAGIKRNRWLRHLRHAPRKRVFHFQSVKPLGTAMEHDRPQRRQCGLGCDTTPRPGATETRGLQLLVRAEAEHAEGGAVCEGAGARQSYNRLDEGLHADLMMKHVVDGRHSTGRPTLFGCSAKQLSSWTLDSVDLC